MKRQLLLAVGCQGLQQYIHCGFFQGQKACGNLTAVVCGPSSCCFVSNCTYHLYHLTVPTSKRNPLSRRAQQANGNHMNHVYWQSVEAHRSPAVRDRSWGDSDPVCTTRRALIPQTQENTACVFSVESLTGQRPRKLWSLRPGPLNEPFSWNVCLNGQKLQQLTDTAKVNAHNLSHTHAVSVQPRTNSRQHGRQIDLDPSHFHDSHQQIPGERTGSHRQEYTFKCHFNSCHTAVSEWKNIHLVLDTNTLGSTRSRGWI